MKKLSFTAADVKRACNELLISTFPDIAIYGNGTVDGYKRPSFFTELLVTHDSNGRYQISSSYTFKATYFEATHDEARCFEIYETVREAFDDALIIKKDGRKYRLIVDTVEFQWIDTNADKMQITIDFMEAAEVGRKTDDAETAAFIEANIREA